MNLEEKKVSGEIIYNGKILSLHLDNIILPNDKPAKREVIRHSGAACIACLNEKNELALIKQFRYPIGEVIWELPAGRLNLGEDPHNAAIRELSEETGLTVNNVLDMGYILPTPGYSSEVIYLYAARISEHKSSHPDEGEFVENTTLPLESAVKMVYDGEIPDSKSALLILKVKKAVDDGRL